MSATSIYRKMVVRSLAELALWHLDKQEGSLCSTSAPAAPSKRTFLTTVESDGQHDGTTTHAPAGHSHALQPPLQPYHRQPGRTPTTRRREH
jgi:hypothetical protein